MAPAGSWIGRPRRRVEDARLVAGGGCFVEDARLPGTLALAILRSPYPHALIRGLDLSAARSAPGVVDALGGADTAHLTHLTVAPAVPNLPRPLHLPLAVDRVRYVGDEVAAVLAEDRATARDALDLVEVEYEPLPGVAEVEAALEPGAPLVHEELGTGSNRVFQIAYGHPTEQVEQALAAADHVVHLRLKHGRLAPVAMEPRTVLAHLDPADGVLRVWTSSQRPFFIRDELGTLFELPLERVRVVAPDVGGAFGSKGTLYREEVLVAALALKHAPRPVRWVATRSEDLATSMHARDQVNLVRAGFSRAGDLQALDARILQNAGAYLQLNTAKPPTRTATLICGLYRVPVARAEVVAAFTNTVPTGPYRGAGRPEGAFLIERAMDVAARELDLDPVEIRRRNFIQPDEFPWTTPTGLVYDSGRYAETLSQALELADGAALRRRRDAVRAAGGLYGVGLSTFIEPSAGGWESGRVVVSADGSVRAATGSSAQGQGHRTTFAQVVADRLGVDPEQVRVVQGDTGAVASGVGTFGSRSTALGGSALARAAERVLEKMRLVAGHLLEVAAEDVKYDAGAFHVAGVARRTVSFADVAAAAHDPARLPADVEPGLDVAERFEEQTEAYSYGAHLAAVRVDAATGRVVVERFVAVDDCGTIVNPLLVEGQIQGGLAQGFGQALAEQVRYEADGTLVSGTLGDYAVPRAKDLPPFELGETCTPTPLNPLGAKGVGEGGAVGAPPALVNAVLDALAPRGIHHLDMPLTASRVWEALQAHP